MHVLGARHEEQELLAEEKLQGHQALRQPQSELQEGSRACLQAPGHLHNVQRSRGVLEKVHGPSLGPERRPQLPETTARAGVSKQQFRECSEKAALGNGVTGCVQC